MGKWDEELKTLQGDVSGRKSKKEYGCASDFDLAMLKAEEAAIGAMQELQMYRANKLCLIPDTVYQKQCEELDAYKEIGTIEDVRDAIERQEPKKVIIKPWSPAVCPRCGKELSEYMGDGYYSHPTFLERCPDPNCAQRLEW